MLSSSRAYAKIIFGLFVEAVDSFSQYPTLHRQAFLLPHATVLAKGRPATKLILSTCAKSAHFFFSTKQRVKLERNWF